LDPQDARFRPGSADRGVVAQYYRWLDEQIGVALELLEGDTIVLVVSGYGAQTVAGRFAINEWLIREELLVLEKYPEVPTPFEKLKVNWSETRVWAEGGSCARLFFNLEGREPQGLIPKAEYDFFQDRLTERLGALQDPHGRPLQAKGFKPKELYREVRGSAPDLVVEFGALAWRSVSSVGHGGVYVKDNVQDGAQDNVQKNAQENAESNDPPGDLCNPAPHGMFILAAPNCPLSGEFHGASLLDIAPTLLDLGGYQIPDGMQGRSLVAGIEKIRPPQPQTPDAEKNAEKTEAEKMLLDRLRGLGYV
jgi:predicted AlkP superfamily phosphohydrolase/phosphomutase